MLCQIVLEGTTHRLELQQSEDRWICRLDGLEVAIDCAQVGPDALSIVLNGKSYAVKRDRGNRIFVENLSYEVAVEDPRSWRGRRAGGGVESGPRKLTAPMPGKVVRVLVAEGASIQAGQGILVVEAMKMQNEMKSPKQGTLRRLLVREGASVNAGEVLALVE